MKYDASTGHMCFSTALFAMKKGGTVNRASLAEKYAANYLTILDGHLVAGSIDLPGSFYRIKELGSDALLADDWVGIIVPLTDAEPKILEV